MISGQLNTLPALVKACRPQQWSKNLLVFAAPVMSFRFESEAWLSASGALIAFCLISSSIYLLNDCLDVKADRAHPTKRNRPIAAGLVTVPAALTSAAGLTVLSLMLGALIAPSLAWILLLYLIIQVGYCLKLKHKPLLDLFSISSGFLLRAIAGTLAASLPPSPWFLLTIGLLALFLAIEKRKAELQISQDRGVITREVLERYSFPLLLRLESLVATSAFMSYALWASGPLLNGAPTSWMLLTVPFVLAGIFRYQLLSDPQEAKLRLTLLPKQTTEKPEQILMGDRGIKLTVAAWLFTTVLIGVVSNTI